MSMKTHTLKRRHTHYNKCHIHGHASLKYFPFDFLIFSDLLSYKIIRNLFLSGAACVLLLYSLHIRIRLMCFWNSFLEENKGVHKLAARTAIRQSLWLEKNNYPGLFRACTTTQPPVKAKRKRLDEEKYKIKIRAYDFDQEDNNWI